jgi:L-threonylcarbamoyladenylate synthase
MQKWMQTAVLDSRADLSGSVRAAVQLLRLNALVAIPTETVYGLAGNALEPEAVAKERPSFDPLIVHIANSEWLRELTRPNPVGESLVRTIIERFWPGPLTILFPKTELVPDIVTAGLEDVAIRMPNHPVFAAVLQQLGKPLAAPSANRFGKVSPTQAEHVLEELRGRIPLILDAGQTTDGVESTIVRVAKNRIEILRPGPITEEALREFAPTKEVHALERVTAPGQTASHYAPEKRAYLFDPQDATDRSEDSALLCWGPIHHSADFSVVRSLSENRDLREAARRLFTLLREMDQIQSLKQIFIEPVPEEGLGKAIMNRVRRAVAPREDR